MAGIGTFEPRKGNFEKERGGSRIEEQKNKCNEQQGKISSVLPLLYLNKYNVFYLKKCLL